MMPTKHTLHTFTASLILAAAATGCATDSSPMPQGNEALGIARFEVTETPSLTKLVALDAAGVEVGHLALTHGVFTPMPEFAEDFDSTVVDGLSLDVDIAGESTRWQNAGYAPVLSLPAIAPSYPMLGQFLEDPHVAAILSRWQVGFEPFRPAFNQSDEVGYTYSHLIQAQYQGTSPYSCSNCTSLGTVNSPARTINTCGATTAAVQAAKINMGTEWMVLQTCFNASVSRYDLLRKSCPVSGDVSTCGTSTGACKGCPLVSTADAAAPDNVHDYVSVTINFDSTWIFGYLNILQDSCTRC